MSFQNCAYLVQKFQSISKSEKQWKFWREFILRNLSEFQNTNIDHLLSLSIVWANHVFLGCHYSQDLMEKVKEMAEDIEVEDAPVFKTQDEIMKQRS
ncbi:CDKN2AIP N-terminal-like protein [Huso huso]|uniref:CDKN2AIP N-terminal-like protein n=1 Tax=Huso huso TaxID=61971 RepID=A0ABR0YKF5_HUSHU